LAIEFHLLIVGRNAQRRLPPDCRAFFFDVQRIVQQTKPFINEARGHRGLAPSRVAFFRHNGVVTAIGTSYLISSIPTKRNPVSRAAMVSMGYRQED
jgi:hypothetical protein